MRIFAPAAVLLLLACNPELTGPRHTLEVRTDRATYAPWDTVAVEITNGAAEAMYVAHCNHRISLLLERRQAGAWTHFRQVNGPLCQAIHPMGDSAIVRGTTVAESVVVGESGEFRLTLWARRASEDFGSVFAASPPFSVAFPPD
jgi:hypothetical protein